MRSAVAFLIVLASAVFSPRDARAANEVPADGLSTLPEAPPEAPPSLPRKKGIVLESRLGALGFMGQFRHVAPTAPWMQMQVGYEVMSWLMLFGYGELAFSDTSEASGPPSLRAFPIFGFGAGGRATYHATERVALFGALTLGAMKADVPNNALAFLGFKDAESIGASFGARVGIEWYQVDRHLALGFGVGIRDAQGFAKRTAKSDTPLMIDASIALRYTF